MNAMNDSVEFRPSEWDVNTYLGKIASKEVDLQPDFQRNYIWTSNREQKFIDSILRGFAVPPVWLWAKFEGGKLKYKVIDGQQRLTCVMRFSEGKFQAKNQSDCKIKNEVASQANGAQYKAKPGGKELTEEVKAKFMSATIPHMIVTTQNRDLIKEIFKRLNQGSMNLNPQELRNAFYDGGFKQYIYAKAQSLKEDNFWGKTQMAFSDPKTNRMEVESRLSEIVANLMHTKFLNHDEGVDKLYEDYDEHFAPSIRNATVKSLDDALKSVKLASGSCRRFVKNASELYTLISVFRDLRNEHGNKLKKRQIVEQAGKELQKFGNGFTQWQENLKQKRTDVTKAAFRSANPTYDAYRSTVSGPQREVEQRKIRFRILMGIIEPTLRFTKTDKQRFFSMDQKDLVWAQSSGGKSTVICRGDDCKLVLHSDQAQYDHIKAWSHGGRTTIDNCQILCRKCNGEKSDS